MSEERDKIAADKELDDELPLADLIPVENEPESAAPILSICFDRSADQIVVKDPKSGKTSRYIAHITQSRGEHKPLTPSQFREALEDVISRPEKEAVPENAPDETEFDRQKRLFFAIPEAERARFDGRFVVSVNGAIVDSDRELAALTRRFFAIHGDAPLYIAKVGEPIRARVSTPFFK